MEKERNTSSSSLIAVFLTIIALLVCRFWLVPQYKQDKTEANQVTYEADAVKGKLDSLKSAQTTLDSLGSVIDSMFVAIPKDTDTGNIVTTLEAIASANKIYIPSFQITGGGSTASTGTTETASTDNSVASNTVAVSFSASGSFADLNAMIKSIESNLKFFNAKSISVASDDKGTLAVTLQLDAYTQNNTASLSVSTAMAQ